jgi:DNA-binding beta-propeller fold protein YncE
MSRFPNLSLLALLPPLVTSGCDNADGNSLTPPDGATMLLSLLFACAIQSSRGGAVAVATAATLCAGCTGELELVADVDLPGAAVRFDYQDLDPDTGHLIIAHMNDDSVVVVNLSDGSTVKELPGIPTARGIAVAPEAGLILVTSSPDQLVEIDRASLDEVRRVSTGRSPDGVGWDGDDGIVGVSDQGDGALSLIADDGAGDRTQIALGDATGNVVYDASRGWFWITAEESSGPDRLVAVDPVSSEIAASLDLPGCSGAHGLRLHPDGASAFIACEGNSTLARVDLASGDVSTGTTGSGPDVLSIDPGLGWLYVAAESGNLTIFDLDADGVSRLDSESPGANAHTVAVDPATHNVYFPLPAGSEGTPVLRIMRPRRLDE